MSDLTFMLLMMVVSIPAIVMFFWRATRIYKAAPAKWKFWLYIIWPTFVFAFYLIGLMFSIIFEFFAET